MKDGEQIRSLEDVGRQLKDCKDMLKHGSVGSAAQTIRQELTKRVDQLCLVLAQTSKREASVAAEHRYHEELENLQLRLYSDPTAMNRLAYLQATLQSVALENQQLSHNINEVLLHLRPRIDRCEEMLMLITKKADEMLRDGLLPRSQDDLHLDNLDTEERFAELKISTVLTNYLRQARDELYELGVDRQQLQKCLEAQRQELETLTATLTQQINNYKKLQLQYHQTLSSHNLQIRSLTAKHDREVQALKALQQQEAEIAQKNLQEQVDMLAAEEREVERLMNAKAQLTQQIDQHRVAKEQNQRTIRELRRNIETLKRDVSSQTTTNEELRVQSKAKNEEISKLTKSSEAQIAVLEGLRNELQVTQIRLEEQQRQNGHLTEGNNVLYIRKSELENNFSRLQNQFRFKQRELDTLKTERDALAFQVSQLNSQITMKNESIAELEQMLSVADLTNTQSNAKIAELNDTVQRYITTVDQQRTSLNQSMRDITRLRETLSQAELKIADYSTRITDLTTIILKMEESSNQQTSEQTAKLRAEIGHLQSESATKITALQSYLEQLDKRFGDQRQQLLQEQNLRNISDTALADQQKRFRKHETLLQDRINQLETTNKQTEEKNSELNVQLLLLQQKHDQDIEFKNRLIQELEDWNQALRREKKDSEETQEQLRRLNTALDESLNASQAELERLKQQLKREASQLNEARSSQDLQSRGKVVSKFKVFATSECLLNPEMEVSLLSILQLANVLPNGVKLLFQSTREEQLLPSPSPDHILLVLVQTDTELIGGVSIPYKTPSQPNHHEKEGPSFIFSIAENKRVRKLIVNTVQFEKDVIDLGRCSLYVSREAGWTILNSPGHATTNHRQFTPIKFELYELSAKR